MQSNDTSLSHRQSITVTSDHYATSQAVVNAAIEKGLTRSFEVRYGLNIFIGDEL